MVKDSAGGVVPGAMVVVTNPDTGAKFDAITNSTGTFNVPALPTGRYTVTVSLQGFKTTVLSDVRVQAGVPANVTATLEVGGLQETVKVKGEATELINTRTATVTSTLNADQIAQLPTPTRDLLLGGVTFLVGVNFTGIARGTATVNGLPESFLNITLDGVSNNDNFNKSTDGFFAPVRPRQDAIEAVTVTTAAGGADVGGHGAVSINFVTRSGTNRFTGSAYEYYRDTWMNSNYWFNENVGNPRNEVQLNQFGARIGGPIVIPGVYDGSGKAFYFFHYEQLRLPNNVSRTRQVLQPAALNGSFKYNVTVGGQVVRPRSQRAANRAERQLAVSGRRPHRPAHTEQHCGRHGKDGRAVGTDRSDVLQLRLAHSRDADRASARRAAGLQPRVEAPLLVHLQQAVPGSQSRSVERASTSASRVRRTSAIRWRAGRRVR